MKEKTLFILEFSFIFVLAFILGYLGNNLYQSSQQRTVDGLYLSGNISYERAKEVANIRDKKGDWVCINVAYDMPMDRAYEVCVHECSHASFNEIFAERCEKNITKCLEYLK